MSELLEDIREICRPNAIKDVDEVPQEAVRRQKPNLESVPCAPRRVRGHKQKDWDANDVARLVKRWAEVDGKPMERARALGAEFPGRTPLSIYWKVWALKTNYRRVRTVCGRI